MVRMNSFDEDGDMKNEPGNPIPDFAERMLTFVQTMRKSLPPEQQMDSVEEILRSVAFGNPPGSELPEPLPEMTQTEVDEALANPDLGKLERARRAAVANGLEFDVKINARALYIDPQSPLVRDALDLAGCKKPTTVSYGTDGAMFGALQSMIVCGPGDIAQAHTNDEFITLDALDAGTALFEKMIRRWCNRVES